METVLTARRPMARTVEAVIPLPEGIRPLLLADIRQRLAIPLLPLLIAMVAELQAAVTMVEAVAARRRIAAVEVAVTPVEALATPAAVITDQR